MMLILIVNNNRLSYLLYVCMICMVNPILLTNYIINNINRLEESYNDARNDQKFIRADADRIATVLVKKKYDICVVASICCIYYIVLLLYNFDL